MRKNRWAVLSCLIFIVFAALKFPVYAAQKTVKTGIYAEDIDLSGLTKEEASAKILSFVEELKKTEITLIAAEDHEIHATAGTLGLYWSNPEILEEAFEIGEDGNIVERYKIIKDLEYENKVFAIETKFDMMALDAVISAEAVRYDVEPKDAVLMRENGKFVITPEVIGYHVDLEGSLDEVYEKLSAWDRRPCTIALKIKLSEPRGRAADLEQVRDVLGSFTTSFRGSSQGRASNVANGCGRIDGTLLYPGEEFAANETMGPITKAGGYFEAGTYSNGQVVEGIGGGICQVSSTLYNAVLRAELEVTKRSNHSMTVGYVIISADAALAEESGKNFKFVNNTEVPIYIEGIITANNEITFNIYGKETRPASRSIRFENEILEEIPSPEEIIEDPDRPVGYLSVKNGFTGYKAKLWKIISENGAEVKREQVNTSNYRATAKTATVGTGTDDPELANEVRNAIATGSIDAVRGTLDAIASR